MSRRATPANANVEGKRTPARKSPKADDARVRDLEKRLAEAREQQTATSAVLHLISSFPTDIQPTLDAVSLSRRSCASARSRWRLGSGQCPLRSIRPSGHRWHVADHGQQLAVRCLPETVDPRGTEPQQGLAVIAVEQISAGLLVAALPNAW